VLVLDVAPDGESFLWAEQALECDEAMALVADAATYRRRQYPAIPRQRDASEAGVRPVGGA
jgi:hypothetical protein